MALLDLFKGKKPITITSDIRNAMSTPMLPQSQPLFINTLKAIPGELSRQVGQPSLRAYAALGGAITSKPFTPSTQFQKDLYGTDKPITFRSVGGEVIGEESKAAPFLGAFFGLADLVPGGQTSKQILRSVLTKRFGSINLIKGKKPTGKSTGFGQEKIEAKGLAMDDKQLVDLIENTPVKSETNNRIILEDNNYRILLSKDWFGKKANPWLMNIVSKKSVRQAGFEPATNRVSGERSTSELLAYNNNIASPKNKINQPSVDKVLVPKTFQGLKGLSTKLLEKFKGMPEEITPQQFNEVINKATKEGIKQVDLNMIKESAKEVNGKINLTKLAKDVQTQLVPLTPTPVKVPHWSNVGVDYIGDGRYFETVYQSPVKTIAGEVHFSRYGRSEASEYGGMAVSEQDFPNYFSHVRAEAMPDGKSVKLLEVQSDLMQKENFSKLAPLPSNAFHFYKWNDKEIRELMEKTLSLDDFKTFLRLTQQEHHAITVYDFLKQKNSQAFQKALKLQKARYREKKLLRQKELSKLQPYSSNDPLAQIRTFKEFANEQFYKNGKERIYIPTGETAMKIEGLGENAQKFDRFPRFEGDELKALTPDDMKVGDKIRTERSNNYDWIITDILGEGKFKAIQKQQLLDAERKPLFEGQIEEQIKKVHDSFKETFDISGKADTKHFVYKLNEEALPKAARGEGYIVTGKVRITNKNRIVPVGTKTIESNTPGEWWEVLKGERPKQPVLAFGHTNIATLLGAGVVSIAAPLFIQSKMGIPNEWTKNLTEEVKNSFPFDEEAIKDLEEMGSTRQSNFSGSEKGKYLSSGQEVFNLVKALGFSEEIAGKIADINLAQKFDKANIKIKKDLKEPLQKIMAHEMLHHIYNKKNEHFRNQKFAEDWYNSWNDLVNKDPEKYVMLGEIDDKLARNEYDMNDAVSISNERYSFLGQEVMEKGISVIPQELRKFYVGVIKMPLQGSWQGTNYDPTDRSQNRPFSKSNTTGKGAAGIEIDESMVAVPRKKDNITAMLRLGTVIYIPELKQKFLVADLMNKRFNGQQRIDFATMETTTEISSIHNKSFEDIIILREGNGYEDVREYVESGEWEKEKNKPYGQTTN